MTARELLDSIIKPECIFCGGYAKDYVCNKHSDYKREQKIALKHLYKTNCIDENESSGDKLS